jgi:flagellar motor protein MotB
MLTFHDLMTLLLAFFILVLSFSALPPEKASLAAASAVSALGAERLGGNLVERFFAPLARPYRDRDIEAEKARREGDRLRGVMRDRQAVVAVALASVPGSQIDAAAGGFAVRMPMAALFAGESFRPEASPKAVLDRLAEVSRTGGGQVAVEIQDAGPESRDTGAAGRERLIIRSDAVARYLNGTGGIPAERIFVSWTGASGAGGDRRNGTPGGEIRLGVAFTQ